MKKVKILLHFLISIIISFVFIYLVVFFGGWKLIESRNIILIEFALSVIVGIVVGIVYELSRYYDSKFSEMQNQIKELEKRIENLTQIE